MKPASRVSLDDDRASDRDPAAIARAGIAVTEDQPAAAKLKTDDEQGLPLGADRRVAGRVAAQPGAVRLVEHQPGDGSYCQISLASFILGFQSQVWMVLGCSPSGRYTAVEHSPGVAGRNGPGPRSGR